MPMPWDIASLGPILDNGAFTYAALAALKHLPATATYRDWFDRIRKALPSPHYPQSPNLFGSDVMKAWPVLA